MVKKRNVFDINFDPDAEDEEGQGRAEQNPAVLETKSYNVQGHPLQNTQPARRGPMASAISEAAAATVERSQAEAAIRAENDNLAMEHVRLKKLGLITDLLPTAKIGMSKLTRDRLPKSDPEMAELKASILAVGLSNPIRVEQSEDGYELIQGFRRLSAFRELATETNDPRYLKIPAALVPRGEPVADLYRKMVDENLVRKDISFGEMAQLALSYAKEVEIDVSDAVGQLYASALKQKRSYIRQFAAMLEATEGTIQHIEAIPRALGLELHKILSGDGERAGGLIALLAEDPAKDAAAEVQVLRTFVAGSLKTTSKPVALPTAKTSLRIPRPEGEARVLASDGRIELRLDRDFSGIPRSKLQAGIEALLNKLDEK
ncbi:MAG: ParB N-terminal domain-containing protein [Rhodobacteraceae bacterium]|nr:ParB N-terminal domain-containing protein [Paracoccaceae bacterium]